VLLSILKGLVVASSAATLVVLVAALIEERIARAVPKDPDYRLALGILRPLCKLALIISVLTLINYVIRFYTGLPGSLLPGPEANSAVSLGNIVVAYAFYALPGIILIRLLRRAESPDEDELARRRRAAKIRREVERKRIERERERREPSKRREPGKRDREERR
jgi:hypothetical protein